MESMECRLTETEVRVLGALIEKDITTPEYYPLSLNALVNACNQKTNRDPVMRLDEDAVREALEGLQQQRMAGPARGADSRVTKYERSADPGRVARTRRAAAPLRSARGCAIGIAEADAARTSVGQSAAAAAGNERIAICASVCRRRGGIRSAGACQRPG
jgi:hypothetical protein